MVGLLLFCKKKRKEKKGVDGVILTELIVYCAVMLLLGYYFSRKKLTQSDFLLGGKKLPGWALAFSERATGESSWLLLGLTGFTFANGLSAIWVCIGIAVGISCAWLFLAKRFMRETNAHNLLTIPDFLSLKFQAHARLIRWTATLLIVSFFMFYLGAQFAGAGKTLFSTFDLDITAGILLTALIVVVYASLGGFMSVVWTDVIQSLLMVITLVVLPVVALFHIAASDLSIGSALANAPEGVDSWTGGLTGFGLGLLIVNNLAWFFGYLGGQPQLTSRFMALRNEKEARTASVVGIIWTVLAYGGAFLIGITALTLYDPANFSDVETVLPHMVTDLLPSWISGILLAGILAAIMSTADSQLLVVTSSVSEDIMHKALGFNLTERQLVAVSRVTTVVAGIVGLVIALTSESLVYLVVSWAWAGVGCTLSAAVILAFFWKRTSGIGIVATIVTGFLATVVWISTPLEEVFTSRAATFFMAMVAGVVFSLMFPDRPSYSKNEQKSATV